MSELPSYLEFKLQHIVIAVKDIITEWHDLGLHLGLPESTLKLIGSNPDIEGHLRMMLSKWLDYDPQASWDKLANALNVMGKNTVAANIRSKFVGAVSQAGVAGDAHASGQGEKTETRKCTKARKKSSGLPTSFFDALQHLFQRHLTLLYSTNHQVIATTHAQALLMTTNWCY